MVDENSEPNQEQSEYQSRVVYDRQGRPIKTIYWRVESSIERTGFPGQQVCQNCGYPVYPFNGNRRNRRRNNRQNNRWVGDSERRSAIQSMQREPESERRNSRMVKPTVPDDGKWQTVVHPKFPPPVSYEGLTLGKDVFRGSLLPEVNNQKVVKQRKDMEWSEDKYDHAEASKQGKQRSTRSEFMSLAPKSRENRVQKKQNNLVSSQKLA